MTDYLYCPICVSRDRLQQWALLSDGIELKKRLFRRNTYDVIESHKPCPGCGTIIKSHTVVEISR
ncbi:hypothetical protein LCGC14_1594460 [marine sediment metagenome]|uniref:Uncharacterized protein n=1 Tax=marine sediment metagenome TaxID=412755 RepID=A0A0F9LDF5_9ZZZZ